MDTKYNIIILEIINTILKKTYIYILKRQLKFQEKKNSCNLKTHTKTIYLKIYLRKTIARKYNTLLVLDDQNDDIEHNH